MTFVQHFISVATVIGLVITFFAGVAIIAELIDNWDKVVWKLDSINPFHRNGPSQDKIEPVDTDDKIYARVGEDGITDDPSQPEKPSLHEDIKETDSTPDVVADYSGVEMNNVTPIGDGAIRVLLEPDGTFEYDYPTVRLRGGQIQSDEIRAGQLRAIMDNAQTNEVRLTDEQMWYEFDSDTLELVAETQTVVTHGSRPAE